MSVQKKRISKTRTRKRRSHHALTPRRGMESPIPGDDSIIVPHRAHEFNGKLYSWKELKEMMQKPSATESK